MTWLSLELTSAFTAHSVFCLESYTATFCLCVCTSYSCVELKSLLLLRLFVVRIDQSAEVNHMF